MVARIFEADAFVQEIADSLRVEVGRFTFKTTVCHFSPKYAYVLTERLAEHFFDEFIAVQFFLFPCNEGVFYFINVFGGACNVHVKVLQTERGKFKLVAILDNQPIKPNNEELFGDIQYF